MWVGRKCWDIRSLWVWTVHICCQSVVWILFVSQVVLHCKVTGFKTFPLTVNLAWRQIQRCYHFYWSLWMNVFLCIFFFLYSLLSSIKKHKGLILNENTELKSMSQVWNWESASSASTLNWLSPFLTVYSSTVSFPSLVCPFFYGSLSVAAERCLYFPVAPVRTHCAHCNSGLHSVFESMCVFVV